MLSPISWTISCLGRWQEATAEAQKALRTAEEFADRSMMSFVAWILTVAYTCQGDLRRAVESGQQAVQHAPAVGALVQRLTNCHQAGTMPKISNKRLVHPTARKRDDS
jgi:hypothetical protein